MAEATSYVFDVSTVTSSAELCAALGRGVGRSSLTWIGLIDLVEGAPRPLSISVIGMSDLHNRLPRQAKMLKILLAELMEQYEAVTVSEVSTCAPNSG